MSSYAGFLERLVRIIEENLILIAVFILTMVIFQMIKETPDLTQNEGFMYLATGIIITGLVNGIIQKTNTQQQRSNEKVTQTMADALATSTPTAPIVPGTKLPDVVIETDSTTVNTNVEPQPSGDQPAAPSPRPSWVV